MDTESTRFKFLLSFEWLRGKKQPAKKRDAGGGLEPEEPAVEPEDDPS
jgi:hypothetical protein